MHLGAVCWPALCLAAAAETDPDAQEVEHLALPPSWMCVAGVSDIWTNGKWMYTQTHTQLIHLS